jgi:hypothetical protein
MRHVHRLVLGLRRGFEQRSGIAQPREPLGTGLAGLHVHLDGFALRWIQLAENIR